jgi:sugar phosphate isomerase/epimerase
MANFRISFQLYSARKSPPVEAQLDELAAVGYDAVEPYAGVFGDDPAGFRAKVEAVGLSIPTAHLPLADLDADRARFIDVARALGVETAVLPHVGGDARPGDLAGWKAFGARLNDHAAALADAGIGLAWHDHDFEYRRLADGSRPIDHILAGERMKFEPDIGWIVRAGADATAEIDRYADRIAAFHIKDTAPAGVTADDGWTDVGSGTIDWRALWPAIERSGTGLLVVEHDNPSDWRPFAVNSYKYLNMLTGRG